MASKDPLQSFLSYIAEVKPYHTKVYEVVLAYTYAEPVKTTVKDTMVIHTTVFSPGATLPNGLIVGGANLICDGIGWDTLPFDTGMYDFPYVCDISVIPRVNVTITEQYSIQVTDQIYESILGVVTDNSVGWDDQPWDYQPWDLVIAPQYTVTDTDADTNSAKITEKMFITLTNVSTGVVTTFTPLDTIPGG